MFIRFVRPNRVAGCSAREGFFRAAYELRDSHQLDQYSRQRLENALAWFRSNLIVPKTFNRTNSKARLDREFTAGLSWFKHDARRVIAKAFDLVALLEEHGYMIEILRTERVGFIVYEDKNQVVAEPFSDTPT